MAKMPKQKPGRSVQIVETPPELIEACGGNFEYDLAATNENKKAPLYFGPGSDLGQDSLAITWPLGRKWLNPEFANIRPWAQKCAEHIVKINDILTDPQDRLNEYIVMLVPAAIGTRWFKNWVFDCPFATIEILQPKPTFVGHQHQFPKDMVLVTYHLQPNVPKWAYFSDWKPKAVRQKKASGLLSTDPLPQSPVANLQG